jgi:hypothetical protein
MQKYTPDYTLIREAIDSLYSATRLHANECYPAVLDRINEARTLLTQYLAQDNMVPDDDTYDGYYKAIEVEEEIARLKEQHDKEVNPEEVLNKMAHEAKGIKRLDDDLKAKVVRHGQINRQYKQRLDGVGNPDCPLYDKVVRITGTFDQIGMSRDDVAAACQRLGAKSASEGMCKSMQVVIIGNNPGPTKQAKIEQLRAEGHDITTISQFDFKEILNKYDK